MGMIFNNNTKNKKYGHLIGQTNNSYMYVKLQIKIVMLDSLFSVQSMFLK
jgi:hypothetical protein